MIQVRSFETRDGGRRTMDEETLTHWLGRLRKAMVRECEAGATPYKITPPRAPAGHGQPPAASEPSPNGTDEPREEAPPTGLLRSPRRRWAFAGLCVLAIVGGLYGGRWVRFNQTHAGTDDATVDGDLYQVNARVAGRVLRVFVQENQPVQAGQLLVEI